MYKSDLVMKLAFDRYLNDRDKPTLRLHHYKVIGTNWYMLVEQCRCKTEQIPTPLNAGGETSSSSCILV